LKGHCHALHTNFSFTLIGHWSLVIGYGIYELVNDDNGDDAIPIKHWLARMEATF